MTINQFTPCKSPNFFTIENATRELGEKCKQFGKKAEYSLPNDRITAHISLRPAFERMAGVEVTPLPRKGVINVFVHEYPELNEKNQLIHPGVFEITERMDKELWNSVKSTATYHSASSVAEDREDGVMTADFTGWHYPLQTVKELVIAGYEVKLIDDRTRCEIILQYDFTLAFAYTQKLHSLVVAHKAAQAQAKAEAELKTQAIEAAKAEIVANGEQPNTEIEPSGQVMMDTTNIHGTGSKFIITKDYIWYLLLNGMDRDDWSQNNVTGRYRGWRIPFNQRIAEALQ